MKRLFFLSLLLIVIQQQAFSNNNRDSIGATIEFRNLTQSKFDSIEVNFWEDYFMGSPSQTVSISKIFSGTNLNFRLHIPNMKRPGYIRIIGERTTKKQLHEHLLLVEQGDQVTIIIHPDSLSFSGIGADKYKLSQQIGNLTKEQKAKVIEFQKNNTPENPTYADNLQTYFKSPLDQHLNEKLVLLEKSKKMLSKQAFSIIRANIIGYDYDQRHLYFLKAKNFGLLTDSSLNDQFKELYNKYLVPLKKHKIDDNSLLLSDGRYLAYIYQEARTDAEFKINLPNEEKDLFSNYQKNFSGQFREKLMVDFLLMASKKLDNYQDFLEKANEIVKTPSYQKILKELDTRPKIGDPAFNFKLEDTNGNIVSLESLKGKILFIDFWYTGCVWCSVYYNTQVKEVEHYFNDNPNVQFITVSIDLNRENWIESVKSGKYTNEQVFNLYTMGMGNRHPFNVHYRISGYPRPLIIDKKGKNLKLEGIRQMTNKELIDFIEAAIEE